MWCVGEGVKFIGLFVEVCQVCLCVSFGCGVLLGLMAVVFCLFFICKF